jgi:uncharacterized protein (TIGR02001 family)
LKTKFIVSAVAAVALSCGVSVSSQAAEVSAAVGASNFYLWRGFDLGQGSAQVWGDLNVSQDGFYGGVWASSGDDTFGNEYDLYAGYGAEYAGFTYDLSYWTYAYPSVPSGDDIKPTDIADVIGAIGYGPVTFTAYLPVAAGSGDGDFSYFTLGGAYEQYSALLGYHTDDMGALTADGDDYFHVNLGYAYNDNLAFTVVIPVNDTDNGPQDPLFNVAVSLPLEF